MSAFGYSFFEAFSKRKEKQLFLEGNLNSPEKRVYKYLENVITIGLIIFVLQGVFSLICNGFINGWTVLLAFPIILAGIIKQTYRRVKLSKYGFAKRISTKDKIIGFLSNLLVSILVVLGLIKLFYSFS